jgi:hypothetical protein
LTRRAAALAFCGYLAVSVAYFGVHVIGHPSTSYIGYLTDPEIFIWSLAWWPHAVLHAVNPFVTHAVWAPDGLNLGWTATAPGLAIAFSPLTLAVGPVVAYNVAAVLMPALAAWTAFLLCRHVTHSLWPALVGGYLFGFSAFMLGHELGHLNLTASFLIPLVALVVLSFVEGELDGRGLVLRLAPLLAGELWLSIELSFTLVLALVVALATAYACDRARRGRLRALAAPVAASYGVAALLAAPLVYYLLSGFRSETVNPPGRAVVADLLNVLVPTRLVLASGGIAYRLENSFSGNVFERGSYIGIPALLMVGWFAWRRFRRPSGRFLLLSLAFAILFSLGSWLHAHGRTSVPLPWRAVTDLPLFDNVVTARFALYVSLAVAVIVALTASSSRSVWLHVVLPVLCVLALLPDPRVYNRWHVTPHVPAFFTSGLVQRCLGHDANVIALPYEASGDSTLWQVRAKFRFRQAGGYVTPQVPGSFARFRAVRPLIDARFPPGGAADVLELARAKGVSAILVDANRPDPWRSLLAPIAKPVARGGVLVYPLAPLPAACRGG